LKPELSLSDWIRLVEAGFNFSKAVLRPFEPHAPDAVIMEGILKLFAASALTVDADSDIVLKS